VIADGFMQRNHSDSLCIILRATINTLKSAYQFLLIWGPAKSFNSIFGTIVDR